ncbi:hypothetical protein ACEQ8H_003424 [Pleosporales sp. CAS-2024a]
MALSFLSRRSIKSEKATAGTTFWANFTMTAALPILLRFFQFVLGITVIALYAVDLDRARRRHVYIDSKWVWSVVCGTLGALVSLLFMLPLIKAWFFFYVDAFVWLCYLVAFGIFGKMYIPENPEGNKGIIRMKHAVWVLLTNMCLWFITACYGGAVFWKHRKASTVHTGRGSQHV